MAPKKNLLTSPRFLFPFVTVILLIAGFAVYYLVIIRRQESAVDERGLRSLAAVGIQFKDFVSTRGVAFRGATKASKTEKKKLHTNAKKVIREGAKSSLTNETAEQR